MLTDEDMPSLESLDENSDYSSFLSPGVSERLRRRALRRLFTSAVFNVPDGLDDYDDDFTSFEALGDIVTSDMRHQAEVEEERARQAQARQAQAETEPASGSHEGSGPSEGEPLAHAHEEAASHTGEAPPGEAGPADSAALAGSEPPEVCMAEDSPERSERADPAPTEPESGSEPMHAREPAGRVAGGHERDA